MAILHRNHCDLYYEEYGDGEALIMLHGNGEDQTYFKYQIPYFAKMYHVIVMDMRGHGKSQLGEDELNFALFCDDVIALMDALCVEKAHIIGFSDGGNTALTIALHAPQRVHSLVLNGANLSPKGIKTHIQLPIMIGYHMLSLFPFQKARRKQQILGLMVNYPHIETQILHSIQIPTLVLVGTRDMVKECHSICIARALPKATFHKLDGSHFIAQDCPDQYNECIQRFLQNVINMRNDMKIPL